MKKTAIQSFILYTDVRPVLDLVPQEDGLQLLKTIFDYAAGEEVEPFQNIITEKIWEMIRQKLEVGREKAIKRSETNRQNIKSRWDKEPNTTVYDGIQKDTTVYDSKKSYTKGATEQNSTVQYCDSTELSQLHVQDSNITDSRVSDPAGAGPAGAAAADAAPRPVPESDLFTIRQIRNCIRKNNIDLSEDGAAAFLEDMRADNWTLYGKPVEKKTIVRVLREWAKRHGEYSARDPEEEDRAAAEKERRKEQAAQRIRQREEAEAAEKAAAEEEARRKREAEERRKEEEEKERKRPQLFADLLPVTKEHSRPDKVPEQLRELLKRDNIPEFMLMAYCAAKDYFPAEMPVSDYPEEFTGQYCIPFWDKIRKEIRAYTRECGQRG